MKSKKIDDKYVVVLEKGERLIETIKKFCSQNDISSGFFFGIGALDEAELMHYIVSAKKYTSERYKQPLEITNLTGNVTMVDGDISIHCHITLGDVNMEAIAGHLKEGIVGATCEIVLIKLDAKIERKLDEKIGLNLMDI